MKKAYLYVVTSRFTKDDAAALRVFFFCKILKDLGKDVIIIGLDEIENNKIHVYKGIKYISLRDSKNSLTSRILNLVFFKERLKRCITNLKSEYEIEGLFFYDIPFNSISYLKKLSAEKHIKLYHDSVEWYSSKQFKWGLLSLQYILKNLLNRYFIDKRVNVFAISKFLYNYYQLKGIRVTRIPVTLDMKETYADKQNTPDKLVLVYAGSPGKKDYLKDIVEGLSSLEKDDLKHVEVQLLGIDRAQLISSCGISENIIAKCGNSLSAFGRVSRAQVLQYLKKADFTVLLRSPELRYAKAGFPTKVVESLATGTPVICNITSDLGDYLLDGENCLIVNECTPASFKVSLQKALTLTHPEKQQLCLNARKTAEQYFDYRIFKEQFNSFICEK